MESDNSFIQHSTQQSGSGGPCSPLLLLGPIIGQVTATQAKILFETAQDVRNLEIRLVQDNNSNQKLAMILPLVRANRPTAVEFLPPQHLLEQNSRYRVELHVEDAGLIGTGSFKILQTEFSRPLNIAALSCNQFQNIGDGVAWRELGRRVLAGEIDVIFHMGDQVYLDDGWKTGAWGEGKRLWEEAGRPDEITGELRDQILSTFQQVYHRTWGHEAVSQVLANVSNLMILDDHEIRDDWGSDRSEDDPELPVAKLALEVYRMYQRQLRLGEDYWTMKDTWDQKLIHEGYCLRLNASDSVPEPETNHEIGVLVIDERCGHSFGRHMKKEAGQKLPSLQPFLSKEQWHDIKTFVRSFEGNVLLVVTSVPICYKSSEMLNAFAATDRYNDLRDHFQHKGNIFALVNLLDLLKIWKDSRTGRVVQLLGGDIHMCGFSSIALEGNVVAQQVISSPIGTMPLDAEEHSIQTNAMNVGTHIGYSRRFIGPYQLLQDSTSFLNAKNFALIHVEPSVPVVTPELICVRQKDGNISEVTRLLPSTKQIQPFV